MEISNEKLCEEISKILDELPKPWTYLSTMGMYLRRKGIDWTGKLQTHAELCDNVAVLQHPTVKERIYICKSENKAACEAEQGTVDFQKELETLPRALVLAFTIPTKNDESVYITQETGRIRFYTAKKQENESHIHIEDKFRKPGLPAHRQEELTKDEARDLYNSIREWEMEHNLNVESVNASRAKPIQKHAQQCSNALTRLLAAIPQDLRSQISIPADITELLMKHM